MTDEPSNDEQLETEIRGLLAELGVEPRHLDHGPGEAERAETDLAAILASRPDARGRAASRTRPRRARTIGFFAAAAVLALGLVVVRPWAGSSPVMATTPAVLHLQDVDSQLDGGSASAAPAEFRKLAAAAATQQPAGDGPVQAVTVSSWLLSTDEKTGKAPPKSVLTPVVTEHLFLPDGTFRSIERRGSPLDTSGRLTEPLTSTKDKPSDTDETFDGPEEGPDFADRLSRDQKVLRAQLVDSPEECADTMAACLASRVTFLHYNYVLEPATAAAVWRALADQDGFTFLGKTRDRLDRPAVAFAFNGAEPGRRQILLADPVTGALLGSEEILVKSSAELGLKAPAVIEFNAVVRSRRITGDEVPDPASTTVY
ncbi:MAG: CU044_5270 family protein [Aeromicrobium sp.]